jgi:4-aminobutyrate aminotransferase-like enzyme
VAAVRGLGLLLAIECTEPELASRACARALARGVIVVPSGDDGRVLSLSPPLCIAPELLEAALAIVAESLC